MATWIKADGTKVKVEPANKKRGFTLEEMYRYTNGGPIEIVPVGHPLHAENGTIIVLNEEGKLTGLPYNAEASRLYDNPHDVIVGDVLVCKDSEVK